MTHGKVQTMKTCRGCGEDKDLSEYGPDRRTSTGRQARCLSCLRPENAARYKGIRADYVRAKALERYYRLQAEAYALLGSACRACGDSDLEVLELDHVNNDGHKEGRNRGGSKVYPRVIADPERFQLLCANCHRRKTRAATRLRRLV